jgi:hypothetical protein
MASCDYCGTTILFEGRKAGGQRFCNERCHQAGALFALSQRLPQHLIQQRVWELHQGLCPKCHGSGPVDVHTSYRVWSALIMTSWANRPHVSCRSCGRKAQLADATFSLVLGWWGMPWGLIMTPVQVGRNVIGMVKSQDTTRPSAHLEKLLRLELAAQVLKEQQS